MGSSGHVGAQGAGFTPTQRQLSLVLGRRENRAQKMLSRLQTGPATTWEMMQLGGAGFSSRLRELRNQGWEIEAQGGPEEWVYVLKGRRS
jgi:hypothetical protein